MEKCVKFISCEVRISEISRVEQVSEQRSGDGIPKRSLETIGIVGNIKEQAVDGDSR